MDQYLGLPSYLGTHITAQDKDRAEQDKRPHLKMENLGSRTDFFHLLTYHLENTIPLKKIIQMPTLPNCYDSEMGKQW